MKIRNVTSTTGEREKKGTTKIFINLIVNRSLKHCEAKLSVAQVEQ